MDFSQALNELKQGAKVRRAHWGGYWFLTDTAYLGNDIGRSDTSVVIVAVLKDTHRMVPATAYQEDLLATDWEIVE